jgi:hypothetical protein
MNTEKIKGFIEDEINQTVAIFEEEYPELSNEFQTIQKEMYETFAAKTYGLWFRKYSFRRGYHLKKSDDKQFSLTGIAIRLTDKVSSFKKPNTLMVKIMLTMNLWIDTFCRCS